ncbi:MAG: hypothetical protein KW804_00815 [Candidatus Doudnabacteria bacterium]|nr:hypothetical protein [Candidatus Doudnabacteria bacterium]
MSDNKGQSKNDAPKKGDDKKTEEKKSTSETLEKLGLFADVFFGLFGHPIGNKLIEGAVHLVTKKTERIQDRPKHIISFGEAFTKLKEVDEHAYQVIRDFLHVYLRENADRNDFQVRTALMGGDNVQVTVAFLQLVAEEPDHKSRKDFLDEMGIIGERAIDPIERGQLIAKKASLFLKTRGIQAWAWIQIDLDKAFVEMTRATTADNIRLQAELDCRRNARSTKNAPAIPAAGGNYFKNLWRALRGR